LKYSIEFKPQAIKDLEKLSPEISTRIVEKVTALSDNLAGDV
jgi:mRNA interferase RelE/StbE